MLTVELQRLRQHDAVKGTASRSEHQAESRIDSHKYGREVFMVKNNSIEKDALFTNGVGTTGYPRTDRNNSKSPSTKLHN